MKIENIQINGFKPALRGMRNPKNSWNRSDTVYTKNNFEFNNKKNLTDKIDNQSVSITMDDNPIIGEKDLKLATTLISGGPVHSKFARYITVSMDITASLDFFKEYDTYKVATVANSTSTMHTITKHPITIDNFSIADLRDIDINYIKTQIIPYLNGVVNDNELSDIEKTRILSKINLLGWEQTRTVLLNYETLHNMFVWRKNHKLYEWRYLMNEYVAKFPYFKEFYIDTDAKKTKYIQDIWNIIKNVEDENYSKYVKENVKKYIIDNNINIEL